MKIAIYARVSSEKQEKEETINSQLEALRGHAKNKGYQVVGEYLDNGYSGELLDRPDLDKLRDDAKKSLFEAILVHSPDRLSRKYIYLGLLQEELKKRNVSIIFLNRPDSKDTPEENLLSGVQGLIAEFEKAKIIERTRRGRLHKAKSNILVGSRPPYGYLYVCGNKSNRTLGHYEINEKEAEVVKLIFTLFIKNRLSIRGIAKELTKRKILPQRGKHWRTSSLHRVLRNETYIGITHYNKNASVEPVKRKDENKYKRTARTSRKLRDKTEWVPITLPESLKIIDSKTFHLAQEFLKTNSDNSPRNVKYQYLLRSLIKCGKCDSPYQGCPHHGKLFYRCGNRGRTFPLPKNCDAHSIKAETLEKLVWESFCSAIKNPALIIEQVKRYSEFSVKRNESAHKSILDLDRDIVKIRSEENRLLDAYRESILSLDQLKEQMSKITQRIQDLEKRKRDLLSAMEQNPSPSFLKRTVAEYCEEVSKCLEGIKGDFEAKRFLISRALKCVLLDDKTVRIKGNIPAYVNEGVPDSNIASSLTADYDRL